MQIVIDIPEEIIKDAKDSPNYYPTYHFKEIWRAITNGTPLPKGHGRLIDGDACYSELKKEIPNVDIDCSLRPYEEGIYSAMMEIKDTPAILAADKEE